MSLMIRPRLLAVTSLAAVALTDCAAFSGTARDDGGGEGAPTVLASFYPLEYLAAEIGGAREEVDCITPPGAEALDVTVACHIEADKHTARITARQTVAVHADPDQDGSVDQDRPLDDDPSGGARIGLHLFAVAKRQAEMVVALADVITERDHGGA